MLAKQEVDGVETRLVYSPPLAGGAGGGGVCLQERDATALKWAYVWDMQSPGGIGGLLELTPSSGLHYDYLYDGKGNVRGLLDINQNIVASYEYDPFGVLLSFRVTPGLGLGQPRGFSTKYFYGGPGILKYEYRDYIPALGTFAEKDPMGERADINLYRAMNNSAGNFVDPDGLVNLNLIPEGTDDNNYLRNQADNYNPLDRYTVAGHGNWATVAGLSPSQLANLIKRDPSYHGQLVELDSCSTAQGGRDSFAAKLADLLNTRVRASASLVYFNNFMPQGNWVIYSPTVFLNYVH